MTDDGPAGFWERPTAGPGELRRFAAVLAAAAVVISMIVAWRGGTGAAALIWVGVALAFGAVGWLLPGGLLPVYVPWMYLARILAWVNSRVLLAVVFYSLFTIIGMVMRVVRYDPLHRRFQRDQETYWQPVEPGESGSRHFEHQF